jgi:hypothetical protein
MTPMDIQKSLFMSAIFGLGVISIGTLGIEIWTEGRLADIVSIGIPYLSLPIGAGVTLLGVIGLVRNDRRSGLIGIVFGLLYCLILVFIG